MKKRSALYLILGLTAGLAAAGLSAAAEEETETEAIEVKKIVIGTEGAYAPYNLVNEDGEPDGYDIAVAKAIDELIPEVEFEYVATGWEGIFTALESGKIDIINSECGWNEERASKYLYPDIPYDNMTNAIIFKKGRDDIKDIESLTGLTVTAGMGSANTTWLENYNEENGNPINITYNDGDATKMLQEIIEGRADATLGSAVTTNLIVEEQGLQDQIDWVFWVDNGISPTYWLLRNDEEGQWLKGLIDEAMQTLIDDGTLSELSIEYLGADYSTEEAVLAQLED
jgi:ABC-type amino acid transport substrate-binding protein